MKAFSEFYDDLLPELPGCTTALVDHHLLRVAREYCDRTAAWRETLDAIAYAANTLTYSIFPTSTKTELVRLLSLTVGTQLQWVARDIELSDSDQPLYQADEPPFTVNDVGDEITLTDQPAANIVLIASLRPSLAAVSLPNFLLTDQLEAMRAGVLSRLMLMGNKPWTDRDLGTNYRQAYDAALNFGALKAARGNTRALLRTRPTKI